MSHTVLVTGAAGYVGSHCVLSLLEAGYTIVALDNLCNSVCLDENQNTLPESLRRVEQLTGKKLIAFYKVDLIDKKSVEFVFEHHKFNTVLHCASLKAVGESVKIPLAYYHNNITGSVMLLETMKQHGVKNFVFSSSATVYGKPEYLPIDECHQTGVNITNPYGRTKSIIEELMKDVANSENDWCMLSLRYFNPIGAHESGEIGEDPQGMPNNLLPFVSQVAVGKQPHLEVFGNDFDTTDGSGVRDYVHVMDLSRGHVMAIDKMIQNQWKGFHVFNIGTGSGTSVFEVIKAFEEVSGIKIPYKIVARRAGDLPTLYADNKKAREVLGWEPKYNILEMCRDTWKWQSKNPNGFR